MIEIRFSDSGRREVLQDARYCDGCNQASSDLEYCDKYGRKLEKSGLFSVRKVRLDACFRDTQTVAKPQKDSK